jgi:cytochrome P450
MVLTLKIAASAFFGSEVTEDVAVIDGAVNDLSHEIAARFKRPILIPDWVPLPGHVRYRRALRRIEQVIARMIAERRSRADERSDLLSLLMLAGTDQDLPMSDRQLRDEAVTMLLAGHETTALALSWTWHLLTRHPDMQEQLATQAHEVLGHRKPTIADLPRLTGAEQVINEAMRLYPPAWAVGREALRDCELGGFPVPAGTAIYMCPWVLHRSARYFDDPEAFRPERWAGDLARRLPRFAYFPFGGGPRVCIGNRFALMEAVLVLTTMVQRIRLERIDDRPVVPFASITLRPSRGVWVRPPSLRH